jgi:hypothetical protein
MKEEWSDWQGAWREGRRSLPDISARARFQRRRMMIGYAGMWVICAAVVGFGVRMYVAAPSAHTAASALFEAVCSTGLVGIMHGLMWGRWREPTGTPAAVLDLMQERWIVRRRATALTRGAVVFAGAATLCLSGWEAYDRHSVEPLLFSLAVVVAAFVLVRVMSVRMKVRIDREIAALDEAKRLLEADETS